MRLVELETIKMSPQTDVCLNVSGVERDELEVDVLLVGAGPANLACAISLQRQFKEKGWDDKTVLVLEKAEDIGYHTLSGAVMDPRGIEELFPDWRDLDFPVESEVKDDWLEILKKNGGSTVLKGLLCPPTFNNHGNVIVSLYRVVRWMKDQAEALGVEVYPGFAGAKVLYEGDRVVGVQTRDAGVAKSGEKKPTFEPGMNVKADVTVFGEGTRGSLAKGLIKKLKLDADANHQLYETGIKEIWEIPEERAKAFMGSVMHTGGEPLGTKGYGGGWIYGLDNNRISIGYVVGLDHSDAKLDPHAMFVEWKQHPVVAKHLAGGKVVRYGAKTIPGGGYWAMPKLQGDGCVLVGDTAGFVNMSRLKGIHLAIKSGLLAADAIVEALEKNDTSAAGLAGYTRRFEDSWAKKELYRVRNFRQAFQSGFFAAVLDIGLQMITGGRGLIARRRSAEDHETTGPVSKSQLSKPTFDDTASMDKLTDVYHSGAVHEEDQASHLVITNTSVCHPQCTEEYGNPCKDFCPAAVYEWPAPEPGEPETSAVFINASNCVHCKTCDVADPYQIIEWTVPEGGGGPKYIDM
ncbi:MAG: electron-transferring-flavoprotein dehydrogenase [Planctomycetota bacterium]|jgi:electron-transferring-flavoprotein dehydrogenase